MARARNIKPGIIQNDELAALHHMARIAFPHLWMLADFNGNMEYKPAKLKVQVLPYDDVEIDFVLSELERGGFIQKYHENGSHYLHICKFKKHQNPHKNEILRGTNIPTPEQVEARRPKDEKPQEKQELDHGSDQVETQTELGQHENGSRPADSGSLIPDPVSLIPEEKPCATEAAPRDISADVIAYLNEKAGRNFRVVETNTKLVRARAKEGATLEDFKAVIDRKCAEWAKNPAMAQYLRPATLFNAEKFNQYIGQLDAPLPVSNLVDGTSRFGGGRPSVDDQNREVARRWAAASGGDCYDSE